MAAPLFVYGTLMPGHLRWPVIEPHAIGWRPAAVEGRIYDSGEGWPVAVFAPGEDLVRGWAVDLDPAVIDVVLAHLDEIEGMDRDLLARVDVALLGGEPAVAYQVQRSVEGFTRIDAWSDQDEA